MHTHQLGRKVRLRQIRASEELPPIAADTNYDPNYQEYRRLQRPVKVYPVSTVLAHNVCTMYYIAYILLKDSISQWNGELSLLMNNNYI